MISQHKTVTVIGAGLAGLSAAYELNRAGWNVTVLEARDRVGGRCCTVRNFSQGLVAEGGGEFVDESHARMIALADQFNLKLAVTHSWRGKDHDWAEFDGKAGRMSDVSVWGFNLAEEVGREWELLSKLSEFVEDANQPHLARDAARLDSQSALDWIESLEVHPFAKKYFIQHIRLEYTCEPERLSLLDLARNSRMYYTSPKHPKNFRVVGGNDQIARALAETLTDVRMNAAMESIRLTSDGVAVSYQQAGSHVTLDSEFAILAVPLTTARLIDFNSSLPVAHQKMVDEISYGAVTKVMIEYRKRFWNERGWNGRLTTDAPINITWHATGHIEHERGIITAYTGGAPGEKLSALSDEERIDLAVSEIERLFPGSEALVENVSTIAWLNEPYTRASYMALAPGEATAHWKTLFQPAGRLFFAGEHATPIQGFMEGAVESGQRAAREIIGAI